MSNTQSSDGKITPSEAGKISKKLAAQFSKAAKIKAYTTLLRNTYGGSFTRKDLKEFEDKNNVVVQWVARREDPVQNFRPPLGFVRAGRGTYAIPADSNPISETVKTVTDVPGGPAGQPVTVEAGEFPTSGAVEEVTELTYKNYI